ncbi:MAG: alkene reductase [Oxalobacter sp.]|nr:alkene reductase [Oxalobacter sp.]
MTVEKLFTPIRIGNATLPNRIIMAPLTRCRTEEPDNVTTDLNVEYYVQRASAGLIISEALHIAKSAQGYAGSAGLFTDAQEAGWKKIVDAVHAQGGHMSAQIWHVGRVSHRYFQEGQAPAGPSAMTVPDAKCSIIQPDGTQAYVPCTPCRELTVDEIKSIVGQYRSSAQRAMAAGFDFVEEHAANGYLLQQFQADSANLRTDQYGGSLENRARIVLEVMDAMLEVVPPQKLGVRISPYFNINGIHESQPEDMALYLAAAFRERNVAYLSVAEPSWVGGIALTDRFKEKIRQAYGGIIIYAGEYTAEKAEAAIASGLADAIGFGRPFIANPDLVARMRQGGPYNAVDVPTIYKGGPKGYTDYPAL